MSNQLMKNYKNKIKEFIRKNISDNDIERTDFESWGFQDIDELYELNDKMVDKCDSNMTIWLINLIKLIKKQKIHNMDKETMVDFDSSGFCWNKDKKLVIFNER